MILSNITTQLHGFLFIGGNDGIKNNTVEVITGKSGHYHMKEKKRCDKMILLCTLESTTLKMANFLSHKE